MEDRRSRLRDLGATLGLTVAIVLAAPIAHAQAPDCEPTAVVGDQGACWPDPDPYVVHPACRNACRSRGRCALVDDECIATSDAHCAASSRCRSEHECTLNPAEDRCEDDRVRRSPAMLGWGIALVAVGGVGITAAIFLPFLTVCGGSEYGLGCQAMPPELVVGEVALAMTATVTFISGFVLMSAGAEKVPRQAVAPALVPDVALGPGGAELRWTF